MYTLYIDAEPILVSDSLAGIVEEMVELALENRATYIIKDDKGNVMVESKP